MANFSNCNGYGLITDTVSIFAHAVATFRTRVFFSQFLNSSLYFFTIIIEIAVSDSPGRHL